ncbi:hypothetical protein CEXT_467071 [Caerostris extrusa]|uniref:Uncharacterized protein n=1 Tax=Caerostris extrusa TaxID=172846 RepID=A0AAV4WFJ1_CAEEX|nr:hypothetical protein CEXT_467071 [Caerostris extrusa]
MSRISAFHSAPLRASNFDSPYPRKQLFRIDFKFRDKVMDARLHRIGRGLWPDIELWGAIVRPALVFLCILRYTSGQLHIIKISRCFGEKGDFDLTRETDE